MKIDFVADTNFLIYVHEGHPTVEQFLDFDFGISFISEVELLGHKNINEQDEKVLKSIINDCFYFSWDKKN